MKALLSALLIVVHAASQPLSNNISSAMYPGCDEQSNGQYSTRRQNGFVPGLFITTSNIPGAMQKRDGTLASRKIVCAHEDSRTSGGSVVVPWARFDKRDGEGGGYFDWDFVDRQMEPWISRGQVVNLLLWPAVQKKDQLFPGQESATPDFIFNQTAMTYLCPTGSAQGGVSEGIALPMFWKPEVYEKYFQAVKQFVKRYEDHPSVNYFRVGLGVGAESYPANGATTPTNYCMSTFVKQFNGATYEEKATNAYETWTNYVAGRVRAIRRFNSKKPIVVTINDFSTLKTIDKTKFPNLIAKVATDELVSEKGEQLPKLGLGVQGATTNDADKHKRGETCYADWCKIFENSMDLGIPLQLQTPLHSGVNGRPGPKQSLEECQVARENNGRYGCSNTGNLKTLIEFSLSVGVSVFELYSYEWFVANDKMGFSDPPELDWYQIYGQQYRDALGMASNEQLVSLPVDGEDQDYSSPPTASPSSSSSQATTARAAVTSILLFSYLVPFLLFF